MNNLYCKFSLFILIFLACYSPYNGNNWKPLAGHIISNWSGQVTPEKAWSEYPRPQLERRKWKNLNGLWEYAVQGDTGKWTKGVLKNEESDLLLKPVLEFPDNWKGKIFVPFPPGSSLSGVPEIIRPGQLLWYKRSFTIPESWKEKQVLLNFGAVDWHSLVWINGKPAGEHKGGYDPFTLNITDHLKDGKQEIMVCSWDPSNFGDQAVGKQALPENQKGYRYTPVSGIWQTVWLESVNEIAVKKVKITPDVDHEEVKILVDLSVKSVDCQIETVILNEEKVVAKVFSTADETKVIRLEHPELWSPDHPFLYKVVIRVRCDNRILDEVSSYFGMRKISIGKDEKGIPRIFLNNRQIFQFGPLDQGYWPDGTFLPANDEALQFDLKYLKDIGCNMVRKHVKVEPERWYYWCDKFGLLVWQDMVCTRKADSYITPHSAAQWEDEQQRMIDSLLTVLHPCIKNYLFPCMFPGHYFLMLHP